MGEAWVFYFGRHIDIVTLYYIVLYILNNVTGIRIYTNLRFYFFITETMNFFFVSVKLWPCAWDFVISDLRYNFFFFLPIMNCIDFFYY